MWHNEETEHDKWAWGSYHRPRAGGLTTDLQSKGGVNMACDTDTEDTDSNAKICKFVERQEKFEGNNKLRSRKQNIT